MDLVSICIHESRWFVVVVETRRSDRRIKERLVILIVRKLEDQMGGSKKGSLFWSCGWSRTKLCWRVLHKRHGESKDNRGLFGYLHWFWSPYIYGWVDPGWGNAGKKSCPTFSLVSGTPQPGCEETHSLLFDYKHLLFICNILLFGYMHTCGEFISHHHIWRTLSTSAK